MVQLEPGLDGIEARLSAALECLPLFMETFQQERQVLSRRAEVVEAVANRLSSYVA